MSYERFQKIVCFLFGKYKHRAYICRVDFIHLLKTSQMTHTQGTWTVGKFVDNDYEPRYQEVKSSINEGKALIAKCSFGRTPEENLANAKLISAAPDMLEALKKIKTTVEYFGQTDTRFATAYFEACEAIKKATL